MGSFRLCWQEMCVAFASLRVCVCAYHAAALLAAVQPGGPAAVQGASALVQALAAGPAVTAGTAEQILVRVGAVAGSPPAVRLPVLQGKGRRCQRATTPGSQQ